jgi:hypothetical protein
VLVHCTKYITVYFFPFLQIKNQSHDGVLCKFAFILELGIMKTHTVQHYMMQKPAIYAVHLTVSFAIRLYYAVLICTMLSKCFAIL